ncbi:hypothetical protein VCHA42O253_150034 [Vibrio chagasii]|nr:hypothetical protein VCHA42O253_150034 [Vibrio chagasii]
MDVKIRAKCAAFTNLKVPLYELGQKLIHTLLMRTFPTRTNL